MDMMTFFGGCKFDASAENHGLQIAHTMVYNQWQKDGEGNLVKEVVWPKSAKTADVLYPIKQGRLLRAIWPSRRPERPPRRPTDQAHIEYQVHVKFAGGTSCV